MGVIMNVRVLKPEDAEVFQALRLRALREHPEAFGSAYEDESTLPIETIRERLQFSPDRTVFGAFSDEILVGTSMFHRYAGRKTRHRAMIGAMYVATEMRGRGIGAALLNETIHHARSLVELEELILAVTVGNGAARALYQAAGFSASHVEQRYIKVDGQYYDIEWMVLRFI